MPTTAPVDPQMLIPTCSGPRRRPARCWTAMAGAGVADRWDQRVKLPAPPTREMLATAAREAIGADTVLQHFVRHAWFGCPYYDLARKAATDVLSGKPASEQGRQGQIENEIRTTDLGQYFTDSPFTPTCPWAEW